MKSSVTMLYNKKNRNLASIWREREREEEGGREGYENGRSIDPEKSERP
jgi:hypothetical protein